MKRILAEQIIPEKVYLLDNEPIIFVCTKEPGWLRGHLSLTGFEGGGFTRFYARAEAVYVESGRSTFIRAHRSKFDAPWELELWRFSECDADWVNQKTSTTHAQVDQLTKQLNFLQRLKSKFV